MLSPCALGDYVWITGLNIIKFQAIQPKDVGQPSNPKSLGISSTMNQAPKKGNTKEGNERTCQTMPGTVDETKSKLQSCVSHDQPTTAAPPSLKPESVKNPANSKKVGF